MSERDMQDAVTQSAREIRRLEQKLVALQDRMSKAIELRRYQLLNMCFDCEDGCDHGASNDKMLKILTEPPA